MTGQLIQANSKTGSNRYFGPNGYNSCAKAKTVLRYSSDSVVAWMSPACSPDTIQVHEAMNVELTRPVFAQRSNGDTVCPQDPSVACISYSGTTSIDITMVVGTLSVSCSPNEVKYARNVTCTASPSINKKFMQVQSWQWSPDDGTPVSKTCTEVCYLTNIGSSGTVTVTALVNGETRVASTRINRLCWTSDSLLYNSPPFRGVMQTVWDSSMGRPLRNEFGVSYYTNGTPAPTSGGICNVTYDVHTSTVVALVHSHGIGPGTLVPRDLCFGNNDTGFVWMGRGPSNRDAVSAGNFGRHYTIDVDSIYIIPAHTVTIDSTRIRPDGSRVYLPADSNWRQHVIAVSRTGPNACVLP
jgi:hypothetical protein